MSHFINHLSIVNQRLFVKSGTTGQVIFLGLSSCLEQNSRKLSAKSSLPKSSILRWDKINFVENKEHFLSSSRCLRLDLFVTTAFWISCVEHFNDNI